MRVLICGLVASLLAVPASAQWRSPAGIVEPPYIPSIVPGGREIPTNTVTPTQRRQRLEAANALRAEVDQMLAAGGGALTGKQIAYVRTRVARINGACNTTGRLIAGCDR
ncbi:hypothetical protein K7957_02155 [Sphingomonas yunnanensis]|uniref:hypothetical protein n=1 Tax=Sphingomonas yunnanensis TaxID=310400 RepID=UPI001CA703C9|nr:hypothetical protein [Sphingomonas yunnanensis]MBY9061734.1 hypothetical protein [Sphingomonas yunnanensis]